MTERRILSVILFAAPIALLAAQGCNDIPLLSANQCGNHVIERGEDCDGVGVGANVCTPTCRLSCTADRACPAGWGCGVDDVQADRMGIARDFAARHRLHVVLKGYRTLIATPDGKVFVNPTGTPGMATGGTGDVLAGMLAAWLGQVLDVEAASRLAVYLHGAAGELADADEGEVSMTAGDLANHIGDAILELTARRRVVQKSE